VSLGRLLWEACPVHRIPWRLRVRKHRSPCDLSDEVLGVVKERGGDAP